MAEQDGKGNYHHACALSNKMFPSETTREPLIVLIICKFHLYRKAFKSLVIDSSYSTLSFHKKT